MCIPTTMDTNHDLDTQHNVEHEHFAPEYRDRLRTWLVKMIDSDTIPGLCWENDEKTVFRMPWKHAGRQDYNLEEDSKIFMAWAKHSGRYREGIDKPEPIVWKTRLRCALNKMPDIKELPSRSRLDISEPYRVYQLLPPIHKASQIRRRFYNRSHSHELNHMKTNVAHSKLDSLQNGNTWSKKLADSKLASEMAQASRTSPLLSGVSSVASPGFWLSPSVNMSLKPPMSTDMLHASGSSSVDAISHLQNFAQGRYPLMTSLHHPFVSFPSTTLPSLFPTTSPSFEALKQLALTSQPSVNSFVGQISARAREAEKYQDQVKVPTHATNGELDTMYSDSTRSQHHDADTRRNSMERESSDTETSRLPELKSGSFNNFSDKSRLYPPELHPLYIRLGESQRRIEALEQDLKQSRSAHAQEREAREQLECEKEKMKSRLERMSDGLRVLATHIHPHDDYLALSRNGQFLQVANGKQIAAPHQTIRASSESPVKREILADSQSSAKINRAYNSLESIPRSAVRVPDKSDNVSNRKNENGKRCASPLDLSVPSPKRPTISGVENKNPCEIKSALILSNSSSPIRSLSSDDKRICSPYSSFSGSPDSVGRSRSLSPLSGPILPQHRPRPVQVS